MYKRIFLIISIIVIVITADNNEVTRCRPKILRDCLCGYQEYDYVRQYVVNCTNTGFNNNTLPLENLPPETEVLIFSGNHIEQLPWNVFGTLGELEKLRIIDLSNNKIRDIPGKALHHVKNVELLILNHNELSIADDSHHPRVFSNFINLLELHLTNAFDDNTDEALSNDLHDIFVNSNLTKLKKLHLEQNEIRSFADHKVFCDLPKLMDLHLGDNELESINFNISCLKHLRFLDLERNHFRTFHKNDFVLLDRIVDRPRSEPLVIDIGKNPLQCSETENLVDWIHKTKVIVRNKESLTCHVSDDTNPIYLLARILKMPSKVSESTSPILTGVLGLLVLTLVSALIFTYWNKISNRSRPLFNAVSKKVHYTTIEAQVDHV